jgi:hypothetical protein
MAQQMPERSVELGQPSRRGQIQVVEEIDGHARDVRLVDASHHVRCSGRIGS